MTLLRLLLILASATISPSPKDDGGRYRSYLIEEGQIRLKGWLSLREEQLGFAGISGRMWVIEPEGAWRLIEISPAGSGKVKETTLQTGKLTPQELVDLAKDLTSQDFLGLPEKASAADKGNPHRVILKFGGDQKVLNNISPRRDPNETMRSIITRSAPGNDPKDSVWMRFAGVANAIESRTAEFRR
jgi:hypothetical protein